MAPEEVIVQGEEEAGATDGKVTVKANTNTLVLAANTARTGGYITNGSAHDAWLSLGTGAAVVGAGYYLKKEGGTFDLAGFTGEVRANAGEEISLAVTEIDASRETTLTRDEAFTPGSNGWAGEGLLPPGWKATPGMNGVGDGGYGEDVHSPEE
jgi:hypothetical protein